MSVAGDTPRGIILASPVLQKNERIKTKVFRQVPDANLYVATEIAKLIRSDKKTVVLGLATGSTPVGVYKELIRMHKEEGLSFKKVVTFNLDEYYPIKKDAFQSYNRFMRERLFNHIDILPENINIPDGELPLDEVREYCQNYEKKIAACGGIDLQLLGIGRTGHIGFNEPGSSKKSVTRLLYLDKKTRTDAASSFFSVHAVPKQAITMGVGTILSARKIFMLAYAEHKAHIIKRAVEGEIDEKVAATFLQEHPNSECVIDMAAANQISRSKCPWTLVGNDTDSHIEWTDKLIRKAVIWLSLKIKKPILKLTEEDYTAGHLTVLLRDTPVHKLNISVFKHLQSTITGWPGGKPTALTASGDIKTAQNAANVSAHLGGTTTRLPQDYIITDYTHISAAVNPFIDNSLFPKKVLIFSPHPDDDVISMGGTFIRLCEQGHQVHVAYQTSGSIAVWDEDVRRFADFAAQYGKMFGIEAEKLAEKKARIDACIKSKKPGEPDTKEILEIKGIIRATEAKSAALYCGAAPENIHFLNMPFYESGKVKKNPLSDKDIQIIKNLIEEIKPQQIYAAGDLSDPHGTHRQCLLAILDALQLVKTQDWFKKCQVFLYRGAWQEWEPHDIEMALPLSPVELRQKRFAIFKHQSQKDTPAFPGSDPREFWQRSEARNRNTAKLYDALGLPEYEAIECFVEYNVFKDNEDIPL